MISMILKMSLSTMLYILLTIIIWFWVRKTGLNTLKKVIIGILFGISSILSTHFGVSYENMIINVRDIGPLAAGLFFSPMSGVLAGLIGGIERYIAGTYFGVSSYTRIACSISTCLAGFVAWGMNVWMFKGRKPSPFYAFSMGAVMEVFHMYVVFITHRNDMRMAFLVVDTCSIPMIIFTGVGLAITSVLLQMLAGEWRNPFKKESDEDISVSQKFQRWLFIITSIVIIGNFFFSYALQSQSAYQNSRLILENSCSKVKHLIALGVDNVEAENSVIYDIIAPDRVVLQGEHQGQVISNSEYTRLVINAGRIYSEKYLGVDSLVCVDGIDDNVLVLAMPDSEVYWYRNAEAYEIGFADILLFTVIYVLIAFLVNQIVVNNIRLINESLSKITNGDLSVVVRVRNSSEFASLSDDINQTVETLKGYINAAEKRIEQELVLARTIQESALPKTFKFPERDEFEIYATMKPAKEVGGDFYDFFFVDRHTMALVIADVSGKGIPAALFMMRSKTAIRSLAESGATPDEVLYKANNVLCEGNDAEMFVTAWIGIIDLKTGIMKCANAGHEYPVIKRAGGEYELFKDKHSLPLAAMPDARAKEYELQLNPGDKIFVYTDGIPEAINEQVEQYGTDKMLETLNDVKDMSITNTLPYVYASVRDFKGKADQFDDITMIGFELYGYLNK